MAEVEKWLVVEVPIQAAYNQWTQFESFPEFMEGVEEVTQLDDGRLHWKVSIGGKKQEYDAVITKQVPDQTVAWRSSDGTANAGNVRFQKVNDRQTEVFLHIVYAPEGVLEKAGDALGFVSRRVEGDLQRFKTFIEDRGEETGAWRGEVHQAAPQGTSNPEA